MERSPREQSRRVIPAKSSSGSNPREYSKRVVQVRDHSSGSICEASGKHLGSGSKSV